jgi:hypothetical protein
MKNGVRGPGTGVRKASAAAVAAVVIALAGACAKPAVPVRLGGLARSKVMTGPRAARAIAALHGRDVAPHTSTVARYGRAGELHLYVSDFAGPAGAQRALTAMLAGLQSGRSSFRAPRRDDLRPDRWFTIGPGGHHVLWVSGSSVYWLAGYPGLLDRAMAQLPPPSHGEWT